MDKKLTIYRKKFTLNVKNDWQEGANAYFILSFFALVFINYMDFCMFGQSELFFKQLAANYGVSIPVMIIIFIFLIIYLLKFFLTTEKFVFDLKSKIIYYEERKLLEKTKETIAPFNGIEMVAVSTKFKALGAAIFASTIVLFLFDGREIEIKQFKWPTFKMNWDKVFFDERANKEGEELAKAIGCNFFPGAGGHKVIRDHHIERGTKYRLENLTVMPVEVLVKKHKESS